jgi:hypothetical protein
MDGVSAHIMLPVASLLSVAGASMKPTFVRSAQWLLQLLSSHRKQEPQKYKGWGGYNACWCQPTNTSQHSCVPPTSTAQCDSLPNPD